jgi:hypothetical protein
MRTPNDRPERRLVIGVAAVVLLLMVACDGGEDAPAPDQQTASAPEEDTNATEVATRFLEAFAAFDVDQANAYLADDATIASLSGNDDLRLLMSYLEATGYEQILDPCEEVGDSVSGTNVRCPFAFNGLRSGELGLGPYPGGEFDLVVRDGEIVRVSQDWETEEFSPQTWEPFADWVSTTHSEDALVMYTDGSHSGVLLTEESIRLWERRTRDYVEEVAG